MATLYVDADACPVLREALRIGRRHGVPVVAVGNDSQNLGRLSGERGVEVLTVGAGKDAADFAIAPRVGPTDVVVTQDIGLASMALARGASALTPRGRVFSGATIDAELEIRHIEQRHRRSGGRTRGPAPFEDDDRRRFAAALERLLQRYDSR